MSYAMARLKADNIESYRNADPRRWRTKTEADLRATLQDERHQKLLAKDGAWWQDVELARAKASGDDKRAAQLQVMIDARLAAYTATIRKLASWRPRSDICALITRRRGSGTVRRSARIIRVTAYQAAHVVTCSFPGKACSRARSASAAMIARSAWW